MRTRLSAYVLVSSLLWTATALAQELATIEERVFSTDADFALGSFDGTRSQSPHANQLRIVTGARMAPHLWVANASSGTVTRVDTTTGKQVARYDSVLTQNWDGSIPAVRPPRDACNHPLLTAVDTRGDAFVVNRGNCSGTFAALTKYAGSLAACVDRNGNGQIDTSRDANGDGSINMSDPSEFIGQADECILWTRNYAALEDQGRSLVVDAEQNVWAAGHGSSKLYKLDGQSGAVLQVIDVQAETGGTSGIQALAIGPGGYLYTSDSTSQRLVRKIDPGASSGSHVVATLTTPVPTFGITVGPDGVVWLGADSDSASGVVRVDFAAGTAQVVGGGGGCVGRTHGISVDAAGDVWAGCWATNRLLRVSSSGSFLGSWSVSARPEGVAVAADERIWVVGSGSDLLSVFNPATGTIQHFPAGGMPLTYSDMTGFQQHYFVLRRGTWQAVHDSGQLGAHWGIVSWNNEPEGATPPGTSITVEVRAADTPESLATQAFAMVDNHEPFAGINGRFVEVRVTLSSANFGGEPVLSDLKLSTYNSPPVAVCQAQSVCAEPTTCTAQVSVDDGSYDPDGDPLTLAQSPAGPYVLGEREVSLTVADASASVSCVASVQVNDCEPPTITCAAPIQAECTGNESATVEAGGAEATDVCSAVSVSGPGLATYPLGTTPVTYTATDAAGNTATCSSSIEVVDTHAPVLSLLGANPLALECAQGGGYTELGATAVDACFGDVSDSITIEQPAVDTSAPVSFPVTYRATDSAGHEAVAVRQVSVQDTLPPTVQLIGAASVTLECQVDTFTDEGAVASDQCSGDVTPSLVITGAVDPGTPGTYALHYRAQDGQGLVGEAVREVTVVDTQPPQLTLASAPSSAVECSREALLAAGAVATDHCAGDISHLVTVSGTEDIVTPGTYPITYSVTDPSGNAAPSITHYLTVQDTQAPVVTINGSANMELECGVDTYTELGATAYDECQGDMTSALQIYGSGANASAVGTYSIQYGVWDPAGNTTMALRTVKVRDTLPPVITLVGPAMVHHECNSGTYVDPGATAADACYGDLSSSLTVTGSVNPWTVGTYTLTFNVQDSTLLKAAPVTRTVQVADTQAPTLEYRTVSASPADQTMRNFTLADCVNASDQCDGWTNANNGTILSIYSDEPEDAPDSSDGSTTGDIVITGQSAFSVRAERQSGGDGRVYGVRFALQDQAGNTREGLCRIQVPPSDGGTATDSGPEAGYTVNAPAPLAGLTP